MPRSNVDFEIWEHAPRIAAAPPSVRSLAKYGVDSRTNPTTPHPAVAQARARTPPALVGRVAGCPRCRCVCPKPKAAAPRQIKAPSPCARAPSSHASHACMPRGRNRCRRRAPARARRPRSSANHVTATFTPPAPTTLPALGHVFSWLHTPSTHNAQLCVKYFKIRHQIMNLSQRRREQHVLPLR